MPSTPVPGGGEALPVDNRTADQISDAFLDLHTSVCDLMLMSRIVADMAERLFEHPARKTEDYLVYHVSKTERDAVLFAIGDVETRARNLKDGYDVALNGEVGQ